MIETVPAIEAGTTRESSTARWALASLSLSLLMPSLDTSVANVALPTLATHFAASFQAVQWIVVAYLLAVTVLMVGAGRLGDIVGRRRMLMAGIVVFTAASLLCGVAPSLPVLIGARVVQGVGAAIMMSLTIAMVGEIVPKENRGAAMGLLGTMSAIGTTLGPSLGGLLIAGFGWHFVFLINVPLGLVNLALAYRTLPAERATSTRRRERFDGGGTLLLAVTLAAYSLAMTAGGGRFGARNVALLVAAAAAAILFVRSQRRVASPLLRLSMFRSAVLRAGLAQNALVSTVLMATLVVGPFYLSRAFGLDASRIGLVMSAGPLMAALAGIPAGRLVDRTGAPSMVVVALLGLSSGLLALATAPVVLGVIGYVGAIVIVTASYALFQAANNTAVLDHALEVDRGVIAGMLGLSRNLGLITGASAMGAIFAFASATSGTVAASRGAADAGLRVTFTIAALLALTALAMAVRTRKKNGTP